MLPLIAAETDGLVLSIPVELPVPTEVPLTADLDPLVDTLADFVSLTVVDRRGLVVAPVPEEQPLAEPL